ncbi:MAG: cupredoxin domain-containing protein [Terriglobales bacterium]
MYRLALSVALLALLLAGCQRPTAPPRHVAVLMKKYAITPAEIRVKQGETIQFEVITEDVQHGFTIAALGVNEPVNPGRPAVFTFTAGKKGTFQIDCGIICGSGHDDMRAVLIVE